MRRVKYILYVPYRGAVLIPITCYEALSDCSVSCLYNKGGCTLFEEDERIGRNDVLFVSALCPRLDVNA